MLSRCSTTYEPKIHWFKNMVNGFTFGVGIPVSDERTTNGRMSCISSLWFMFVLFYCWPLSVKELSNLFFHRGNSRNQHWNLAWTVGQYFTLIWIQKRDFSGDFTIFSYYSHKKLSMSYMAGQLTPKEKILLFLFSQLTENTESVLKFSQWNG